MVEVVGPLGDDQLIFRRMRGREALGRLFEYNVELYSDNPGLKLTDVLGQGMAVRLTRSDGQQRFFHGAVTEFHRGGSVGRYTRYVATLRPWLWFLSRAADCRIFQEKSAPDIIKEVLREPGLGEIEDAMFGAYRTRTYCVQYRETAFNFISRLMEEEGIYYYFQHARDKHTLVLADSVSAHSLAAGYETVPFARSKGEAEQDREQFFAWTRSQRVLPTQFSLTDYDFEKPRADLLVRSIAAQDHAGSGFEVFDFPGRYVDTRDGEGYARARMEEHQAQYERMQASGNPRGVGVGDLFALTEHPVDEENGEYLVVEASYDIDGGDLESGEQSTPPLYHCTLTMLSSQTPFRPARRTPIPVVEGPQTAIVVGEAGQEIWTDRYGRVKVQFPWDRYGKRDEQSSCWLRVSQPTAGAGWGAVQIPRIGQEVIVSFLEGNPDEPLVTGRLYNADQMPPFALPGGGMVSGMKSNSTPGGGGYNEMSMNDTKGQEKITINGQYDMSTTIGHDETISVANNRTTSVGVNDTSTVGANLSETVGANMSLSVGANKSETVGVASSLTIGAAYQVSVGAAMNETVGGLKAEEVGGAKTVAVGGVSSETVGGAKSTSAGGSIKTTAGGDFAASAGKNVSLTSGAKTNVKSKGDLTIDGDGNGVIDIKSQLTLKCGGATIVLKKSGDILIKGAKINIKGSGNVVIKGSKIGQN
jgi:type VI secretion system secreted protein VgrG